MLSLLYSTALFLSNSAEAPRAPAYAPSFCRRTDCNCSPYRTASTQQNTLARRPLRMFLPSDTPAANRSLIYVITCHNTHTESRFLFTPSRRFPLPSRAHNFHPENTLACRPMRPFPLAAMPVATALLSTRSPVNTHAPTHGFSSYRRADSHYLPGHTTFTRKIRLHADARRYAGCNSPFRRFPVASKKNETFFENLRTFFPF